MKKLNKDKSRFLYHQFVDILKKEIKKGKYKPSELIPSERELVQKYKISRTTVRKAVSQLISEGWLYSVPGTGTFVSKDFPSRKKKISKNIACMLKVAQPPLDSPYYSKVLRGMQDRASEEGYQFSFCSYRSDSKSSITSLIRARNLDGVIFLGYIKKKILFDVCRSQIPLVLIDNYFNKNNTVTIVADNVDGAYQATKYLTKLGHKKIYFMGASLNDTVVCKRLEGFKKALSEANIAYRNEFFVKSNYQVDDGYRSMEKLLKSKKLPTAILVINDEAAIGAMKAIKEKSSLKIPEDISIVGFDDIDWAHHTAPPLTTVRLQKERAGSLAIDFLIKQIKSGKRMGAKLVLPTELIIRLTCSRLLKR